MIRGEKPTLITSVEVIFYIKIETRSIDRMLSNSLFRNAQIKSTKIDFIKVILPPTFIILMKRVYTSLKYSQIAESNDCPILNLSNTLDYY